MSEKRKCERHSLETRNRISNGKVGEKNGMYGDHRFRGEKHPMYGTHPIPWNKALRGVFKHSEESKKKSSETQKGKHYSPKTEFKTGHIFHEESRKKISQAHKGKHYSPKTEFKKGQYRGTKESLA